MKQWIATTGWLAQRPALMQQRRSMGASTPTTKPLLKQRLYIGAAGG